VFRSVNRHGGICNGRLSAEAVSLTIKQRVAAIGLDPTAYSGHSLRAGFVTSAARAGVPTWRIRQQTGHASDTMLQRYIRKGELFVMNAAGALL
jgi:integrase